MTEALEGDAIRVLIEGEIRRWESRLDRAALTRQPASGGAR